MTEKKHCKSCLKLEARIIALEDLLRSFLNEGAEVVQADHLHIAYNTTSGLPKQP